MNHLSEDFPANLGLPKIAPPEGLSDPKAVDVLSPQGVEKLTAAIVAGMIKEAAYRGVETSASELSAVILSDPNGETASYFRRSASDSLDLIARFHKDPELFDVFGGAK